MAQFKALTEKAKVNGQTVLAIVSGMETFQEIALEILAENGIDDPKPMQWYSQQSWLNAFKQIAESVGEFTLFEIGNKILENADWPPHVNSIETALSSIDVAYHMNHSIDGKPLFDPSTGVMTEGIGHYHFEKRGDSTVVMVCDNPYPSDFDRGIIESAASKFKAPGQQISVELDTTKPSRKEGADSCTYKISW